MGDLLILGGTAWFGRTLARRAMAAGHQVTCLARGESGSAADGAELIPVDRTRDGAYRGVAGRDWDLVVEISWQPGMVRDAARALAGRAGAWVLISSCSVYADHSEPEATESAALLPPFTGDDATVEEYGPAKVSCEQITSELTGGRAMLARSGLIGGDGDPSDRTGYWPGRFALAAAETVLVPARQSGSVQIVDVADLADFCLHAGLAGRSGPVNAVGERTDLAAVLKLSAAIAERAGFAPASTVTASDEWLAAQQVSFWSGPRSLPLWLPAADHDGFAARSDARAREWGLSRRPLADTLNGLLAYERALGLGRSRRSGLSRADERELLRTLEDALPAADSG